MNAFTFSSSRAPRFVNAFTSASRRPRSDREAEVIHLVAEGLTDKEIGVKLSISPKTVSEHVDNVRGKLGATNRASAVYVFFVKMLGRHVQPG